ncbi:(4Fe-4S)-binding protein [Allomuricauda sp. SCSIO 65647]|uniref:(4Fe-4S)-binding protein n=1 Tax=Allomuricauda sp. SCSIO 65647 TaxID=2908843 RepID=UPI001F2A9A15|nr:(4Fe-4S)-binding protein [Muricauda sp. SCSIO 65647]UJH68724.1 (4Fe-4S)-binding protein [Muricauda sp. SCSIO 65647]
MEREIVKEYSKGDFTVIWKPKKCIHSEICWRTLPEVYDPKGKPWINPENASVEALKSQIEKCPSGALTYSIKGETVMEEQKETECTVIENGPLLVSGMLKVTLANGTIETKKRSTAFCRCGASNNKPYCDGTHNKTGFKG